MDSQEEITIVETPSRLRSIITSRTVKYFYAAAAGALSVVALATLKNRHAVEVEINLEPETDSTED